MLITRIIIFFFFGIITAPYYVPIASFASDNASIPVSRDLKSASELDYPPFAVTKKDGAADGFSVDLLKAVAQTMDYDVSFEIGPWYHIKQLLIDGRLDVLPFVSYSKERDKLLDFTASYLRLHGTIFVRKNETSILSEKDLKDKEVLVMKGDTAHEYAVSKHLSDKLILTDTFEEAFKLLSSGKHDAIIIQQLAGLQLIRQLKITNLVDVSTFLKTNMKPDAGPLQGFEQKFCFAVQEGDKELLSRLNEGLAIVITNGVYNELYDKWFGPLLPQPAVSFAILAKSVLSVLLPVLFLMGIAGIWYLKKEVALKTKKLAFQIEVSEAAKNALQESETHLRTLLNTIPDLIWFKDKNGVYLSCNNRFEDFFGAKEKEIVGKTDYDFVDKELADFFRQKDKEAILMGHPNRNEETITYANDGHRETLETIKTPVYNSSGDLAGVLGIGRDITKRKQIEEQLIQERDQFDKIMETSPAGIMRYDAEGGIVYANDRAEKLLGIRRINNETKSYDEPGWKRIDFDGTPYPHDNLPFNIVKLNRKPVFDLRYAIERSDGSRIFISINAIPLLTDSGSFDGIVTSINDITENYQAEQKYRMLFNEMIDGFSLHEIICSENGQPVDYRFLDVNPAFERLTGLTAEAVTGKTVREVLPNIETYWIDRYGQVALTGNPICFENASEELGKFFQVTAFRPAINQFACIFVDVTERKRAEKEIWETKDRFQKVFNSQPDSILVLNSEFPARIIEVNQATEELFGYEQEELIGKTSDILHLDGIHLSAFQEKLFTAIKKDGFLNSYEFRMKRKDGSVFPSEHSVLELKDDAGNRTGWVSIVRDLTERKKLEDRMQQAQKMESIGNLAGGIAHDFNNILFPIMGMTELLMEDFPKDSEEYESVQEIYIAGKRGSELVKQILAFSRQTESKMIPLKIQQIAKEVLKLIRSTIPANIEITQSIQANAGPIMADPIQIHQVMMNLITNAHHAVEETGGKIHVQSEEFSETEGNYVVLTVSDTGCGIEPNNIGKIFEPYFTTKKHGKGTGLGLSVVYGIVKEHNGEIKVFSEPGKGTTFKVFFPLMENASETVSNQNEVECRTGTEKILLVDDEIPIAMLMKRLLERFGYQVVEQTSSTDAVETFRTDPHAFDLVITDMAMPRMTGIQLSEEFLKIRKDIPIIICTGFSEKISIEMIDELGLKGLLMKPVVKSELSVVVRKVLDEAKTNIQH